MGCPLQARPLSRLRWAEGVVKAVPTVGHLGSAHKGGESVTVRRAACPIDTTRLQCRPKTLVVGRALLLRRDKQALARGWRVPFVARRGEVPRGPCAIEGAGRRLRTRFSASELLGAKKHAPKFVTLGKHNTRQPSTVR